MKVTLVAPVSALKVENGVPRRIPLIFEPSHIEGNDDFPCIWPDMIYFPSGRILDGFGFRQLRDTRGAFIEADDPVAICRVLGLPKNERGIIFRMGE